MDTSQQFQQPTPIPPTPPEPPKSFGWLKWVIIIIFVALLSSAGTYFILKSQSKNRTPSPAEVPTKVGPTATPTPDPTTNWKTYTSSRFGYSIRYPSTMEFTEGVQFEFQIKSNDLLATFIPLGLPENETIENYIQRSFCAAGGSTISKLTDINGISIYTSKGNFWKDSICLETVVPQSKKSSIIDIQAKGYNQNGIDQFIKILSTFKFL